MTSCESPQTLDNETEARVTIEDGLRKVGLDPADIRVLVITHGHGDHYGGAQYLIGKYKPQVVMSDADWRLLEDDKRRIDLPGWGPAPKRDRTVGSRDTITLGDTRVDLVLTPGHTDGTLSLIFPVFDKGWRHTAVLWGGTGFNFGADAARYQAYAQSATAMKREVERRNVEIFLSNHVKRDYADRKLEEMIARLAAGNSFVLPVARTAKAFDIFRYCALAQIDTLRALPN